LELTLADATAASRYKKIVAQPEALDALLVALFIEAHEQAPERIVISLFQ